MRRLVAICIVAFFVFWAIFWLAYAIVPSVQAHVNGFAYDIAGPTIFNVTSAAYTGIINTVGVLGFTGIILVAGLFVGIFTHKLWVGADWRLRRWGAERTRRDLGVTGVSHQPSTPIGATTRPSPPETIVAEEKQKEEVAEA